MNIINMEVNICEKQYKVSINSEIATSDMTIKPAAIVADVLFEEYCNDYTMNVSIQQEDVMERMD